MDHPATPSAAQDAILPFSKVGDRIDDPNPGANQNEANRERNGIHPHAMPIVIAMAMGLRILV